MNIIFNKVCTNPDLWETEICGIDTDALSDRVKTLKIHSVHERMGRNILIPDGEIIELFGILQSNNFRRQLLETMNSELILSETIVTVACYNEWPWRFTPIHTDYRSGDKATGMFFFNKVHNSKQTTTFYKEDKLTEVYSSTTLAGKGWFAPVTQVNWHKGGNFTTGDRFFVLYNLKKI